MRTFPALAILASSSVALAQRPLAGPPPEISGSTAKIDLPAIPSFDLPPSEPGFTSVRELRVAGKKHLDTDIKVKGYVIWSYDCVSAVALPKEPRAKTQKRIDEDPTLCERPKLYLGQSANDPAADGLWVVDVPRPPNKLERERLPKDEIKNWPKVPKYKVGDYVVVTGKFALRSPHSEANSDGLVVFQAMEPAKKPGAAPPAPATAPPPSPPTIPTPPTKAVIVKPKDPGARERSIKLVTDAPRAADPSAVYRKAIEEWPGNHVAYYELAIGRMRDTIAARDAMAKAVELAPDQAQYQMVYGVTLYEAAITEARDAEAKRQGRDPRRVVVDPSTIDFSNALMHLAYAVKLEPKLWRAHYYIGRIHRDRGDVRWAAEAFDASLRAAANDAGPWVALAELYRRWHYTDQAIAVAKAGTAMAPAPGDVWFVLGLGYDEKDQLDDAIDAFTRALDLRSWDVRAIFQRGQAYFKKRDFAKAKVDLEKYVNAPDNEFAKQQAQRMLMDIAARKK